MTNEMSFDEKARVGQAINLAVAFANLKGVDAVPEEYNKVVVGLALDKFLPLINGVWQEYKARKEKEMEKLEETHIPNEKREGDIKIIKV